MLDLDQRYTHHGQSVAWGSIGDGDPIILVHGFPWSAQAWRRIAPWLAKTHKVFYFDMLGTGQSEKSADQDVNEAVQSDLLAALVKHWGLEHARPQVVGHDFGGLAALRGHFVNGIAYGKLHLIDAVAVLPSGSPFYAHVRRHEAAFAGLPDYAHEALFRAYIQNAAHYPLREEAIRLYFAPWSGEEGKAAFYRQIGQADIANIEEAQQRYGKTDFDIHLIWGAQDTFIPVSQGKELHGLVDARSFTVLPDAAHICHEDAPEAVLGALLRNI
ncbi:alpha/beta fold hydrolase [Rhodobium gokarnense]|uniref:Pimeloyl-ACP methyl ester carboxylesterase n=1 Tax=Rhodobium gokarnense TaxID=364296 RepID=A0ABT3HHU9_9HYPH|nr:alpha/beta hydrolase [Rhodobium gokarnense]MCW2309978.1 pimeloyl-ACP methyl ester carboxylesterase [Rhodobium gokarnense]